MTQKGLDDDDEMADEMELRLMMNGQPVVLHLQKNHHVTSDTPIYISEGKNITQWNKADKSVSTTLYFIWVKIQEKRNIWSSCSGTVRAITMRGLIRYRSSQESVAYFSKTDTHAYELNIQRFRHNETG